MQATSLDWVNLAAPTPPCWEGVTLERSWTFPDGSLMSGGALGALPRGARLSVRVTLDAPRRHTTTSVILRIHQDGLARQRTWDVDYPLTLLSLQETAGGGVYGVELDTAALCGEDSWGLFYYTVLLCSREGATLYMNTDNQVDFTLEDRRLSDFRLLVYEPQLTVPRWLGEGVMYHIFVDRFCRGQGPVRYEDDVVVDPDWAGGIPQYPPYPGAPLSNHVMFGGNLWGVVEKLDYLADLGVRILYLSPIFRAHSNHKYDTGDYLAVDEGFGGEAALRVLLRETKRRGMRVLLDGVFNHTGDDSLYFNRYGRYPSVGAYQSPDSPYRAWYTFGEGTDAYESWWGIPILPRLNGAEESCRRFFTGPNGVAAHYVRMGVDGWRLDVADELNDAFLDELRVAVKTASEGNAILLGEVWENAADKIAYGHRRRYLAGRQLDSVMNYPLRAALIAFVRDGDASLLYRALTELYASYPPCIAHSLMNLLGTHDTERVLTALGSAPEDYDRPNDELARAALPPERRQTALERVKMAALLQFTVYGVPSIFYGDEVGLEGYRDPFCRRPFPWHDMEEEGRCALGAFYRRLGRLRARSPLWCGGDFLMVAHTDCGVAYVRRSALTGETWLIAAYRNDAPTASPWALAWVELPRAGASEVGSSPELLLTVGRVSVQGTILTLEPNSACILCVASGGPDQPNDSFEEA